MATYTSNLNLKKPAGSENVSIGDINNNMDTIDSAVGTLNDQIATMFVNAPISGNTDSGGNRIVSSSTLKIVSVVINGYIAIPFIHENGGTYVKVLNWGTLEPVANTSVTGMAYYHT